MYTSNTGSLTVLVLLLLTLCSTTQAYATSMETKNGEIAFRQKNYPEALKWFHRASNHGDAEAENALGTMYRFGDGVPSDYATAISWFRKAALKGNGYAMTSMIEMYVNGFGVTKSDAKARKWLRVAIRRATQGDSETQYALGNIYYRGMGNVAPQSYSESLKWNRMAAAKGDPEAQSDMGWMYQSGLGVPKNYATAMSWYLKAAAKDNSTAQDSIGKLYEQGLGVPRNIDEAKKWYQMSASQGNDDAIYHLAVLQRQEQSETSVQITGNMSQERESHRQARLDEIQNDAEACRNRCLNEQESCGNRATQNALSQLANNFQAPIDTSAANVCSDQADTCLHSCNNQESERRDAVVNGRQDDGTANTPSGGDTENATAGYGNMSQSQNSSNEQRAAQIKSICSRDALYSAHKANCSGGNNSECYLAAAELCQCYLNNDPGNPASSSWLQCVQQNIASANALRSNATAVNPYSSPYHAPSPSTPTPTPTIECTKSTPCKFVGRRAD